MIDGLNDLISYGVCIGSDELHNRLLNEDYFIIGYWQAEQFLEGVGAFRAIGLVRDYEEMNFGEASTDFSCPEKVANMYAYVLGEQILNKISVVPEHRSEYSLQELQEIVDELSDLV